MPIPRANLILAADRHRASRPDFLYGAAPARLDACPSLDGPVEEPRRLITLKAVPPVEAQHYPHPVRVQASPGRA